MRPFPGKLSVVIACYKDELAIPVMYPRLVAVFQKMAMPRELVFVNDGSPFDARSILDALAAADPSVVVIHHSRNFGSQAAFTSGMRVATGDAVVLLDGDLQDPPELIEAFVEKWREGFDVVYGQRTKREAPLFMQAGYRVFYRLFRALSYVSVPLDAGDFSLIDRRVVSVLNALPENNRFLRGLRAWVGFPQTGVPYVRPARMFGRSTNSILRNVRWAVTAVVSFSFVPLRVISGLAFSIVAVAFVAGIAQVILRLLFPQSVQSGLTTLIVLILFLGGVQLLCLGIVATYLEHIYDEVKRRPPFIVDQVINDPRRGSDRRE